MPSSGLQSFEYLSNLIRNSACADGVPCSALLSTPVDLVTWFPTPISINLESVSATPCVGVSGGYFKLTPKYTLVGGGGEGRESLLHC